MSWWQMRRVTMEFDYQKAWKQIFGSNSEKIEVLEALRCFKCDTQGLAIICRLRLKDRNMNIQDLLMGKGLLTCSIHRRQVLRSKAAKRHKAAKNANGSSSRLFGRG